MNYEEDYMDSFFDEIPKHRKKKGLTKQKKANHRHSYQKYIGKVQEDKRVKYFPVTECVLCGRIDKVGLWFFEKTPDGFSTVLNDLERIKELNPELETKKYTKFPW